MVLLALCLPVLRLHGQSRVDLFPHRSHLPGLLAGARNPTTSASLLGVIRNPDQLGSGVEAEVSLGSTLPVVLFGGLDEAAGVVVGIEAAVFARFGLQILQRELIATDWMFSVPVVWKREGGWVRLGYFHSSSHMGDEYSRRFEDRGENFSRDAADLVGFVRATQTLGVYGGTRFAYNVKPEDSRRWVVRGGVQWESPETGRTLRPFLAADLEWDEDAASEVRLDLKTGAWLAWVGGRRAVRIVLGFLTGPSPLGQFHGEGTTQISLGLFGHF